MRNLRGWRLVLPPVLALLGQHLCLGLIARLSGFDPLSSSTWVRWDSSYYLDIAAHGYAPIFHCPPESHYAPQFWCGNAGWFPGFPWAIGTLGHLGLRLETAALSIARAAQLGCLFLIWFYLDDPKQWPALVLAAFFPGSIYLPAVFPVSMFLLSVLVCFGACWSKRPALAAAAGFAAACCYPTGLLLAPVMIAWALLHKRWGAAWAALGVLCGFAFVCWMMQRQAGAWDAYFKTQGHYGYRLGFGVDAFFSRLKPLVNARSRDAKGFVTAWQTLLTAILVALALCRRQISLVAIYTAAFWIAPLLIGGPLSLYRSEALLLPAVLIVPKRSQLAFMTLAIAVSIPMDVLFFRGVLV
jgi:hypothetical protein